MIINADQIKDSADIVSIIGADVSLKRQGSNHVGCCPFHEEKTPSFTVTEQKGIFKCFGCGKAGDAVTFVMLHRGLSYPEALEYVAKESRTNIEYDDTIDRKAFLQQIAKDKAAKQTVMQSLNRAYNIYEDACRPIPYSEDERIELYFGRKYKRSTIEKFRISIAPDTSVINDTADESDRSNLISAGWLSPSKFSTDHAQVWYDMFKGRLLFPITDLDGNVLGISGRDLTGNSKAKYINSKESDVFIKRNILYGLPQSFKAIRKKKHALIVEGNTDVLACHDYGVDNAVAGLGTSFTAEQAALLAKYTDVAIIAYDGDALKKDVIQKVVDLLVQQQLFTMVLELPEGHDPDSLLRDRGIDGWNELLDDDNSLYDGIDWCVIQHDRSTKHDIVAATKYAVNMICRIDDDSLRNKFCNSIAKILGIKQSEITREVNDRLDSQYSKKNKLKPYQEKDANRYGVYIDGDCFYRSTNGLQGYAISNFTINPIMLIKGAEESQRLVELVNSYGEKDIVSIQSDDFVGLGAMKKNTERLGNFLFKGKEDDYMNVKEMIYAKFPTCYPINTMGLHKRGFFTWGNGITKPDGQFVPVNRFGIVDYEDRKYYLSTFSEIRQNIESDDAANEDDPGEFYKYVDNVEAPTFREWAELFIEVFGDNGRIALCWYIASMYRDIIFKKLRFFPHLNLFGPPGSGKTYLGWRLSALQGILRDPIDIPNTSIAGMSRQVAQKCNGFIWCDEYKSELKKEKIDFLKSTADGVGRTLGRKSNNNNTSKTPVRGATIISGQVLPNQDPALLSRCATLRFIPFKASNEQKRKANQLEQWEDGRLTQLTAELHKLRPLVETKFSQAFMEMRSEVKQFSKLNIMDRIVNTYSIMMTIHSILKNELDLPIKTSTLTDISTELMETQHDLLEGSEEVSGFFGVIQYLLSQDIITRSDILIHEVPSIKKTVKKSNDVIDVTFEKPRLVMFLYFPAAFGLYREYGKKQGIERLFEKKDLEYYLGIHASFAGICKGKRFSGQTKRCYMFYVDDLPLHFQPNKWDTEEAEAAFHSHGASDHSAPNRENHQLGMDFPHKDIEEGRDPF